MKSIEIKALIALVVITMTLSATIMRETENKSTTKTSRKNKNKSKTMYNGDGGWALGYNCPFIEVLDANQKVIETSGKWSFKPMNINPQNGFTFVLDGAIKPLLSKYVITHASGEKYTPWRFFDEVKYQKKSDSYKMIVCSVRNDKGDKNVLRFNLPWKFIGNYVTVSQAELLVSLFLDNASKQKNAIQANKNNVDSYFGSIKTNQRALDVAKANEATLKASLEANIQKNQALLNERREAMKAIEKQIADARPAVVALNAQEDAVASDMKAKDQQYSNNLSLIDDQTRADKFKNIDKLIAKEVEDVIKDISDLKTLAANYNFDPIQSAASAGDVTRVTQLLIGVQPIMN